MMKTMNHIYGEEEVDVRVRQRAFKSPAHRGFLDRINLHKLQCGVDMERGKVPSHRSTEPGAVQNSG
jgi:hypothetical protein